MRISLYNEMDNVKFFRKTFFFYVVPFILTEAITPITTFNLFDNKYTFDQSIMISLIPVFILFAFYLISLRLIYDRLEHLQSNKLSLGSKLAIALPLFYPYAFFTTIFLLSCEKPTRTFRRTLQGILFFYISVFITLSWDPWGESLQQAYLEYNREEIIQEMYNSPYTEDEDGYIVTPFQAHYISYGKFNWVSPFYYSHKYKRRFLIGVDAN